MSTARDTGLELDEYFDLVVNTTGDLGTVGDIEELEKDISGMLTSVVNASSGLGGVPSQETLSVLEQQISSRLLADDRIVRIQKLTVGASANANSLHISLEVDSIYGYLEVNE